MKRLTAILLALSMALSLAACGSGAGSSGGAGGSSSLAGGVSSSQDGSAGSASPSGSGAGSSASTSEAGSGSGAGSFDDDPLGAARGGPVEGEYYYDLENVVLYLDAYGELPDNYITKKEAQDLGWTGGSVEKYMEGAAIGGDHFGNREGLLPDGDYTECDLNTDGKDSRGAERLVFSDEGEYYYTEDHYESFTQVWVEDGEVLW